MDILKDRIAHNDSEEITGMLLERLNGFGFDADKNGMMCYEQSKGRVEYIGNSDYYSLFFLLEGKIILKGAAVGRILLDKRELILLPPECNISCETLSSSNYVILSCTGLQVSSNVSFMRNLRTVPFLQIPQRTDLPIHENLGRVLKGFFAYSMGDSNYSTVYDTMFLLMRSCYTAEELATLFFPLLHEKDTVIKR